MSSHYHQLPQHPMPYIKQTKCYYWKNAKYKIFYCHNTQFTCSSLRKFLRTFTACYLPYCYQVNSSFSCQHDFKFEHNTLEQINFWCSICLSKVLLLCDLWLNDSSWRGYDWMNKFPKQQASTLGDFAPSRLLSYLIKPLGGGHTSTSRRAWPVIR